MAQWPPSAGRSHGMTEERFVRRVLARWRKHTVMTAPDVTNSTIGDGDGPRVIVKEEWCADDD